MIFLLDKMKRNSGNSKAANSEYERRRAASLDPALLFQQHKIDTRNIHSILFFQNPLEMNEWNGEMDFSSFTPLIFRFLGAELESFEAQNTHPFELVTSP